MRPGEEAVRRGGHGHESGARPAEEARSLRLGLRPRPRPRTRPRTPPRAWPRLSIGALGLRRPDRLALGIQLRARLGARRCRTELGTRDRGTQPLSSPPAHALPHDPDRQHFGWVQPLWLDRCGRVAGHQLPRRAQRADQIHLHRCRWRWRVDDERRHSRKRWPPGTEALDRLARLREQVCPLARAEPRWGLEQREHAL